MRVVLKLATLASVWFCSLPVLGSDSIRYEGRNVQTVLRALNRDGHAIVYSSDVVRPHLVFSEEPDPASDPLLRLRRALEPLSLTLQAFPQAGAWLVVRSAERAANVPVVKEAVTSGPSMEEIVVVSSRHVLKKHGAGAQLSLSADELTALPELGDDAVRAVNYLPGTASLGVSARPHIRGGARDETLVLYNGVELIEPFHLKDFESLFSTFNPSLIERIDVYTGGFPARYGTRMSGVMDIQPVLEFPRFGGEVGVSLLTTTGALYGSSDSRRWALSARRGNLDLLTQWVNPDVGQPSYSDLSGQLAVEMGGKQLLDLGFLSFSDAVVVEDLDGATGERATSNNRTSYIWAKWLAPLSNGLDSTTTLSLGRIRYDRGGFTNDTSSDEAIGTVEDDRKFLIATLMQSFEGEMAARWDYEFGGSIAYQRAEYAYRAQATLGAQAAVLGQPLQIRRFINRKPSGVSWSAYGSLRGEVFSALNLEVGVRLDQQSFGRDRNVYFSPRLNVSYELSDAAQIRLATGRYYQPEAIHELQVSDGRRRFQSAQHADHVVLGFSYRFRHPAWRLRLEAFFKRIREPKVRYENLFNPLVLLPEIKPDRMRVAPSEAYARGVEMTLAYHPNPDLHFWASYTRSQAVDRLEGHAYKRAWSQSHSLQSGFAYNREPYQLSLAASWHSGWRTTALPDRLEDLQPLALRRNADELPNYFSLNVRASRTWRWPRQRLVAFFEVTNLSNRRNVGGYEYEFDEATDGYVLQTDRRTLLPLVPAIGVEWKFE